MPYLAIGKIWNCRFNRSMSNNMPRGYVYVHVDFSRTARVRGENAARLCLVDGGLPGLVGCASSKLKSAMRAQ